LRSLLLKGAKVLVGPRRLSLLLVVVATLGGGAFACSKSNDNGPGIINLPDVASGDDSALTTIPPAGDSGIGPHDSTTTHSDTKLPDDVIITPTDSSVDARDTTDPGCPEAGCFPPPEAGPDSIDLPDADVSIGEVFDTSSQLPDTGH